jgi:ubiquinone/menaquinone biosynthesis C-methylase UbiE
MRRKDTHRTYDRIAARYSARTIYPMTRELRAFLSHVPKGGRVLDVGCGTGEYARMIAARGYWVLALDLSKGMLAQAEKNRTPNVLQADMRHLPLASGWADGCFLSASLLHIPRVEAPQVLSEVWRVLQDVGIVFLSVKAGEGNAWVPEPGGGARFFVYYRSSGLDRLISQAGFAILDGWTGPPGLGQTHRWISRVLQKAPR